MIKIGQIELSDFPLLLAPMENITNPPFRRLCKSYGADLVYSEFISSEGLIRNSKKSIKKLDLFEYERPIGIQIFGGNEISMELSTKIIEKINPNLIDINFGCPVKKIVNKGAGASVLKNIDLMIKITKSVIKATKLPVTVKTRIGWDENSINITEVAERLQDIGVQAISIHGRTRSQMYKNEADWSYIAKVKNNPRIKIPIFGNGDIDSEEKAFEYKNKYGVDGIMIGRATIGKPWIFNHIKYYLQNKKKLNSPNVKERLQIIQNHINWLTDWQGEKKAVIQMRQHYKNYLNNSNIESKNSYKFEFMKAQTLNEILLIINKISNKLNLK